MKTWNEEEYEEFFEEEYFTFQSANLGENQTYWNFFLVPVMYLFGI